MHKIKALLVPFILTILFAVPVQANMGGFSLTPIFPANQNPEIQGYFDLFVTAGTRQEITVAVGNSGNAPIEVSLALLTATTNRNGIIDYTMQGATDETLLHPFAEIAEIAPGFERVRVPPGQAVNVPIFIDIPSAGFDGVILGSIHALLEITEEELAQAGMIVNRFAHAQIVLMREQGNETVIPADFVLGEVTPELVHHRASIVAEIRNPVPRLSMGALAHAQIYQAGAAAPIFSMANIEVDFAPNSAFPFSMIDEAGFGLQPGSYTAFIQLQYGGAEWVFEREFEILPQEAEQLNVAAVNIQHQAPPAAVAGMPVYVIIGAAAALIISIVIIVAMLIVRASKKQTELQNERFRKQMEQLRANLSQTPEG